MFDVVDHSTSCAPTPRMVGDASVASVADVRRLQSEELSIVRVLDERGRIDVSTGLDGESAENGPGEGSKPPPRWRLLPSVAAAARAGT